MSYMLIKRITFKKDGVYFSASSNNITPKTYYSERSPYHSNLLSSDGKEAVDKIILWDFSTGSFKAIGKDPSVELYQEAADRVRNTEEYNKYDNIYWCWDDIERSKKEKELAKQTICKLLYEEYSKLRKNRFQ